MIAGDITRGQLLRKGNTGEIGSSTVSASRFRLASSEYPEHAGPRWFKDDSGIQTRTIAELVQQLVADNPPISSEAEMLRGLEDAWLDGTVAEAINPRTAATMLRYSDAPAARRRCHRCGNTILDSSLCPDCARAIRCSRQDVVANIETSAIKLYERKHSTIRTAYKPRPQTIAEKQHHHTLTDATFDSVELGFVTFNY